MRKSKKLKFRHTIVIIVDGEDEKWYIENVKQNYPCKCLKRMSIKPELAVKKKVDELFAYSKEKIDSEYNKAILILDMDSILKDKTELEKFKNYYQKYLQAVNKTLKGRLKENYGWMENLLLITNTPCLEFWYLLHFRKTNRFYSDFNEMEDDIRRIPALRQYDKSEAYYKNTPDIYARLGGEEGIRTACDNAQKIDLENLGQGVSEMNLMFGFFQELDKMSPL